MYRLQSTPSPLGLLWLAASDAGLRGIWFDGQKHAPDFSDHRCWQIGSHRYIDAAIQWLDAYFGHAQATRPAHLPLDLAWTTAFQQSVWQALCKIPRGQTWSYATLAQAIGQPAAVRATAAAVARNPISILIPCHRVIGSDGSLRGYAGGLERKRYLLAIEQVL